MSEHVHGDNRALTENPKPSSGGQGGRLIVYALSSTRSHVARYVLHALAALRPHARNVQVVTAAQLSPADAASLAAHADGLIVADADEVDHRLYGAAFTSLAQDGVVVSDFDEVVLTGDGWFGPVADFTSVLERMAERELDVWEMVESPRVALEEFPLQGFPRPIEPWPWVAVRSAAIGDAWSEYWAHAGRRSSMIRGARDFVDHMGAHGYRTGAAFSLDELPTDDPALFVPDVLMDRGCPLVLRRTFMLYPPFLDRHAVIAREILSKIEAAEYPLHLFWEGLVRDVPAKALNTNVSMLEVLPGEADPGTEAGPTTGMRIAALVHLFDVTRTAELLERLDSLPAGFDLYVTTTDGRKANQIEAIIEARGGGNAASVEVRVTPAERGRDMSDFFVGCRDVLLDGGYDLIVKVHARTLWKKTLNMQRYVTRQQLDNLLLSPAYVRNVIALFEREPGLGLVFPPMPHIGFAIMGHGWAGFRSHAERLCEELQIDVPLDVVSPLAPFGGMWIGRPEALEPLARRRWMYRDYGHAGSHRYGDLAKLQERVVASVAASRGYHSRTVLTQEQASISYSALDFKLDAMLSTSRGYPVEQITMLQRAGRTGYGGVVALSRMYLRLYHPRVARPLGPLYRLAERAFAVVQGVRQLVRRPASERGGAA